MSDERKTVVIPAETLIHVGGMPFRMIADTRVEGSEANLQLGLDAIYGHRTEGGPTTPPDATVNG